MAEAGAELAGARAESESEEVAAEMEVQEAEAGAEVEGAETEVREAEVELQEASRGKAAAPASRGGGKRTAAALASGTARRDERHVDVGAASSSSTTSAADEMRRCEIVRDTLRSCETPCTRTRARTRTMHAHWVEGHAGSLCSLSLVAMLICLCSLGAPSCASRSRPKRRRALRLQQRCPMRLPRLARRWQRLPRLRAVGRRARVSCEGC